MTFKEKTIETLRVILFLAVIFGILVALAAFCGREPALPVSTQWVIAVYEQPEVGFAFSQNKLHTGAIQHIGTTPYHRHANRPDR